DNLTSSCGNRGSAAIISLDLSASFDPINHQILLEKLKMEFGMRERILVLVQFISFKPPSIY
ncbi:hypothetical protein HELRODRAFT_81334, partial [Helobdella robusta]|uniref:Reverse transcriptase domain-containing protein n=1 Tax=Helobdella robusta TaxID=6412 RepID=T1G4D3_HELRO